MKNKIGNTLLAVLGLAFAVSMIVIFIKSDKKPPEIIFDNNDIIYTYGQDTNVLLNGVRAVDKRDGDVTSFIMVESITTLEDASKAKISYVAKDNNNNIAKGSRVVEYVGNPVQDSNKQDALEQPSTQAETSTTQQTTADPAKPVIILVAEEITLVKGSTFNVLNYIAKIVDDKDTNASLSKKVTVKGTCDTSKVGNYKLEISCKDSNGNESEIKNLLVHVVD